MCQEGLARALRVFEDKAKPPVYKIVKPADGKLQQIRVLESVSDAKCVILNWYGTFTDMYISI